MFENALYYPYIKFQSAAWLKAMSLLYNRVYRIVPDSVIPDDSKDIRGLLEDGTIGININPLPYAKEASEIFMEKLRSHEWNAAALSYDKEEKNYFALLHQDKTDARVKSLFKSMGYTEHEAWIEVPTEIASNYMLFLATEISRKNSLQLLTEDWAPWTATTYFDLNGHIGEFILPYGSDKDQIGPVTLFSLLLHDIIPLNIDDIPVEAVVKFRRKRSDEINNLRETVLLLHEQLQQVNDPKVKSDKLKDTIRDCNKAIREYKLSADILKAKGWFGISFMGLTAPTTLATLFDVSQYSTYAMVGS